MKGLTYGVVALLGLALIGCSSSSDSAAAGGSSNGGGGSGATAGTSSSAGTSSGNDGGTSGLMTPPGSLPSAMPIISHGVPAFAANMATNSMPAGANDGKPTTSWISASLPAWLAYDLSGVPADQRKEVLIAWYDGDAPDFINATPDASKHLPVDYTLEINSADGGGDPPADGWMNIATVTGNNRSSRQHLVDIMGANWVRMSVTKSSDPAIIRLDLDVHAAPDGATDSWLFMGDSITFLMSTYVFSDLPQLVNMADSTRWPAVIPAAIGGTNTTTAMAAIADTMSNFPGRFVTLNYGTNDHPTDFHMEELVQAVIAAGKVPVVPHMPWSATAAIQSSGPMINAQIDALYAKYPAILHGPDFWAIFNGRTDLIPANDIHPNDAGQEEFRKQWATAMTQ